MGRNVVVPSPSALLSLGVRAVTGMAAGFRTPGDHESRVHRSARLRALRARSRALRPSAIGWLATAR